LAAEAERRAEAAREVKSLTGTSVSQGFGVAPVVEPVQSNTLQRSPRP
jgi:hypothetical protein